LTLFFANSLTVPEAGFCRLPRFFICGILAEAFLASL
jgi:hypothetical protein